MVVYPLLSKRIRLGLYSRASYVKNRPGFLEHHTNEVAQSLKITTCIDPLELLPVNRLAQSSWWSPLRFPSTYVARITSFFWLERARLHGRSVYTCSGHHSGPAKMVHIVRPLACIASLLQSRVDACTRRGILPEKVTLASSVSSSSYCRSVRSTSCSSSPPAPARVFRLDVGSTKVDSSS